MPQIIKARVERDGSVHLLQPVRFAQAVEVDVTLPEDAIIESEHHTTKPVVSTDIRARRLAWMKANCEQYGNQYVALDGDRLVAVGGSYPEAARAAKLAGVNDVFVTFVYPPDYVGEVGGWA